MKLLCSMGTFSRNPDYTAHQQVLKYAPSLAIEGVTGFELLFYSSWYSQLDQIANDLGQLDLNFPVMHTEKNIGTVFGSSQAEQREQMGRYRETEEELGVCAGSIVI